VAARQRRRPQAERQQEQHQQDDVRQDEHQQRTRWDPAGDLSGGEPDVQELRVVGVRVELPGNQPILLLKEAQGERYLPIWIGAVEAAAIAFEQQGVRPARPMTHDLLREVVHALGASLEAVHITEMRDGIYIAELLFGDERTVSARPSDAVALAVRTGAPIYGAEALLDEVGIEIPDEQEDEVEKFREFLDNISPEDFGAGSGSGGGPA
jgi:bifunctional DNase/RNase